MLSRYQNRDWNPLTMITGEIMVNTKTKARIPRARKLTQTCQRVTEQTKLQLLEMKSYPFSNMLWWRSPKSCGLPPPITRKKAREVLVMMLVGSPFHPLLALSNRRALCSSVESSVSDSCRKGSTDEYLVIYYDYI